MSKSKDKKLIAILKKPYDLLEVFSCMKTMDLHELVIMCQKDSSYLYLKYLNSMSWQNINVTFHEIDFNDSDDLILSALMQHEPFNNLAMPAVHLKVFQNKVFPILRKQNKKIIGISDGTIHGIGFINYLLANKLNSFQSFLKLPYYFYTLFLKKYDESYYSLYPNKNFFSKKTKPMTKIMPSQNVLSILADERVDTLICPVRGHTLEDIIDKENLHDSFYCVTNKNSYFMTYQGKHQDIYVLPEVLINSGVIKTVYADIMCTPCIYANLKGVKVYPLPVKEWDLKITGLAKSRINKSWKKMYQTKSLNS